VIVGGGMKMKYVISGFVLILFMGFMFFAFEDLIDDCKYSKAKGKSKVSKGIQANNMYYRIK